MRRFWSIAFEGMPCFWRALVASVVSYLWYAGLATTSDQTEINACVGTFVTFFLLLALERVWHLSRRK